MLRSLKMCLGVALVTAPLWSVAAPAAEETLVIDKDEQVDNNLKSFGYLSGLAHGCVETKQVSKLENEIMSVNSELTRLLGSDRAFIYTAAFGYGRNVKVEAKECKEILERYETHYQAFVKGAKA
ncbi:MAG: hypothetical protein ACRCYV_02555 [Aeromonas sp.]